MFLLAYNFIQLKEQNNQDPQKSILLIYLISIKKLNLYMTLKGYVNIGDFDDSNAEQCMTSSLSKTY